MREHIENKAYDNVLRFILNYWRDIKKMPHCEKRSALLEYNKENIQNARRTLRRIGKDLDRTIIVPDPNYPEYYIIIYKEPLEFEGTKEAAGEHLWENWATKIGCPAYDCTGQHFTRRFKLGHLGGNLWKVAEYMAVDV